MVWLLERLHLEKTRPAKFGLTKMKQIVNAFDEVNSFKRLLLVSFWSIWVWCATFAWFYAFLISIDMTPSIIHLVVGSTFAVLLRNSVISSHYG